LVTIVSTICFDFDIWSDFVVGFGFMFVNMFYSYLSVC